MGAQRVDTVDARAGARRAVALRRRQRPRATAAYVLLTAGIVIVAFPFYWMVVSALKPSPEMFDLRLVPAHPTLDNFAQVRSEGTRLNSSHMSISYAVFCLKK